MPRLDRKRLRGPSLRALVLSAVAFAACGRSPLFSDQTSSIDNTMGGAGAGGHAGSTAAGGHAGSTATGGHAGGASGNPGIAGGPAGASGGAGTMGICQPSSTTCVEKGTAASVCQPNGTWGVPFLCNNGCANGVCLECVPGQTTCLSSTVVQACEMTGMWGAQATCAFGCVNGACANGCTSGQTKCLNPMQMQSCQLDGTWGGTVPCAQGCKGDSCLCAPGKSECFSNNTARICANDATWGQPFFCEHGCANGVCLECTPAEATCLTEKTGRVCSGTGMWGNAFTCMNACANGVCSECAPFTSACLDDKRVRTCNDNGTWDAPSDCDAVCLVDQCHACKPGKKQCNGSTTVEVCGTDGEFVDTDCEFVCANSACGQNPKTVFVTSTMYKGGALGGLAGADAKCQARATAAGLIGTYKAWLSDFTGSPATRFPQDVGPYMLVNGSIVANNWGSLTSGSLRHALDITELGGAAPTTTSTICTGSVVWTDTDINGNLENSSETCGDWSDTNGQSAAWGLATAQDTWTSFCNGGDGACNTLAPLYCFQQ
jgi:hypothetical protein